MKQYCVTLTDARIITQEAVGGVATYSAKCILTPNYFQTFAGGSSLSYLPQGLIFDEYAKLYDFYMVE